jgi:hypothetical protein
MPAAIRITLPQADSVDTPKDDQLLFVVADRFSASYCPSGGIRSPQIPQSLCGSVRGITLLCPQFGQIEAFMPGGTTIGSGFRTGGQPFWVPGTNRLRKRHFARR